VSIIAGIRRGLANFIAPETRGMSQQVADALMPRSSSGVAITETSAMTVSAVYAAVRVIAETIAQLEWEVYERQDEANIERYDHPLRLLLDQEPNAEMTAFSWRIAMMTSFYLHGNMVAEIERNRGGRPVSLWWIHPARVAMKRDSTKRIYYEVTDEHGLNPVRLDPVDVYHVPLMAADGIVGKGLVQRARDSFGLTLGMEQYSGSSFANGARPGGILKHPGKLTTDARRNIRDEWDAMHRGADKAGRIAVLQEGMEFQAMQMSAVDAQLLEQRQFQIAEVARWFNIPPHLLRDLSRATFGNIEHQSIEYKTYTIRPLAVAMQQEAHRKLFSASEKPTHFTELDLDDLSLADLKSRYDAYAVARQNGWMSANEIRDREGMNPIPTEDGDAYLINGNMVPLTTAMQATPTPSVGQTSVAQAEEDDSPDLGDALRSILENDLTRLLSKERNAATRAANKPSEFLGWLDAFYVEHAATLEQAIGPTVRALGIHARQSLDPAEIVARHVEQSRQALLTACEVSADKLAESVESVVSRWDARRATEFAREVVR
jgi:HK97 family phage portal protein